MVYNTQHQYYCRVNLHATSILGRSTDPPVAQPRRGAELAIVRG